MTSRNSFTGPSRTIEDSRPSTSLTRPSNRFIINKALVPDQFIVKSPNPVSAQQMDGTSHLYGELLPPHTKIRFVTNCDLSQEYTLPKDSTWVRPLNLTNIDFILGLSFLLKDNGSCTLSKDYIHLHKHSLFSPVLSHPSPSFPAEKHGGLSPPTAPSTRKIKESLDLDNDKEIARNLAKRLGKALAQKYFYSSDLWFS